MRPNLKVVAAGTLLPLAVTILFVVGAAAGMVENNGRVDPILLSIIGVMTFAGFSYVFWKPYPKNDED